MAKLLRLWEKKRGDRRTGSRLVGGLGEALFFGVLFVLGTGSLTYVLTSQLLEPTPEVYSAGVGFWLLLIVLASFALLGGGGLVYAVLHIGTSAERRSVLARRAAGITQIREGGRRVRQYPGVPRDDNLTNSPGVTLAFRLPSTQSPAWGLSLAALFCVLWNTIAIVLVVLAVQFWSSGQPDWILMLLLVPFLGIGAWSTWFLVRTMLVHTGVGPTHVEISDHPLYPGADYEFFLSQSGRLRLHFLEMSLVCEEVATFQQGTDVREEVCRVYEAPLFRGEEFDIEWGIPFEYRGDVAVPRNVMHSLESGHNAVQWKLVVAGKARSWPPFRRSFPVVVYPHGPPDEER